jgi:hypothetical protein
MQWEGAFIEGRVTNANPLGYVPTSGAWRPLGAKNIEKLESQTMNKGVFLNPSGRVGAALYSFYESEDPSLAGITTGYSTAHDMTVLCRRFPAAATVHWEKRKHAGHINFDLYVDSTFKGMLHYSTQHCIDGATLLQDSVSYLMELDEISQNTKLSLRNYMNDEITRYNTIVYCECAQSTSCKRRKRRRLSLD